MEANWSGSDHYNDATFIEASIKMPKQIFSNNKFPYNITYRQLGDRSSEEAVIFIPSVFETEASAFRIAPLFEKSGIRFISVTTGTHVRFESLIQTFDQFFRYMNIKKVHLVGCDFGGFVCLQIQNTVNLYAKIMSLVLINSYTRNDMYVPRKVTAFSFFRSNLSNFFALSRATTYFCILCE